MTAPAQPGPPILVAGMHRSGTSLGASLLAALGVDMGERLLPADAANPRGYFEDLDFLALDRKLVRDATPEGEAGHADWGWTESGRFDRGHLDAGRPAARELIAARAGSGRWGWKDPRASLLLDFWDGLLGDARYLLLYRFPWEVADSMQRLGAAVFLDHPEYAYRIWTFYNRHLLDFHRRHRERSLLVSADALQDQVAAFAALAAARFGLPVPPESAPLGDLFGGDLFRRVGGSDPLIALVAAAHPDCVSLLAELDAAADLSASGLWSAAPLSGARLDGRERAVSLSIVIPCHDDGEFLIEAVASAERSAPEAAELIIVNDGSREARTLEILSLLRQAGYHVIDQDNAGLAAARNRGIGEARGRYLLPLDADNRLHPGFPQAALRILDADAEVGIVYGDRQEIGCRSGRVAVPELDLDSLLRSNFIDACAVLRREVWEQCGGYDGGMPAMGWEDWDLWLGAAERGWRFHRLPDVTFDYRVRPGSMASGLLRAEVGVPLRLHMIDKHYALYRRRLPTLLTAQHETAQVQARLDHLLQERERLLAEQHQVSAERDRLQAERDHLQEERDRLQEEGDHLQEERDHLQEERDHLQEERDRLLPVLKDRERLHRELQAWQQRVAAMESTSAWRLRKLLLRLRRR